MSDENHDIQIASRVGKTLYERMVKFQQEAKKMTGIEPTISEVVRALVERGLEANGKRKA
jgi:hypothetical protein